MKKNALLKGAVVAAHELPRWIRRPRLLTPDSPYRVSVVLWERLYVDRNRRVFGLHPEGRQRPIRNVYMHV
jgi:hypothetical protein